MTRTQLLRLLTGAVTASWLTVAQAAAIRQRYDDGESLELPLPPQEAIQPVTLEQAAAALIVVATLLSLRRPTTILRVIAAPAQTRTVTREQLQDAFQARARVMALLPVPEWHAAMRDEVRGHLLGQYALGLGRPLTAADLRAVEADVLTQLGYLSRFADERAAKALAGVPLSDAQVAARSELYSGAGRSAYFRGNESHLGVGWVCDYRAVDGNGTCDPCIAAEQGSPYLPGQGIFPAQRCLGRGRCRCTRTAVYDLPAYNRLIGRTI